MSWRSVASSPRQRNGFLIDRGQRAHNGVVDRSNDVVKFQCDKHELGSSESLRCERMDRSCRPPGVGLAAGGAGTGAGAGAVAPPPLLKGSSF